MRWWAVGVDQRRGMGTVKFKYSKKNKDMDGKVNMKKCPRQMPDPTLLSPIESDVPGAM